MTDGRTYDYHLVATSVAKRIRRPWTLDFEDVYQDAYVEFLILGTPDEDRVYDILKGRYRKERNWAARCFPAKAKYPTGYPHPFFDAIAPEATDAQWELAIESLSLNDQSIVRCLLPPYNWTQAQIAKLRGMSPDQVRRRMRVIEVKLKEKLS